MKVTLTKKESNAKSEVVSVNILELASELADMELKLVWGETRKGLYEDEESCITTYSDEAQDLFNDLYDKYYSLIDSIQEDVGDALTINYIMKKKTTVMGSFDINGDLINK